MVEGARLESVLGVTAYEGSNPSLSAKKQRACDSGPFVFWRKGTKKRGSVLYF